MLEGGGKARAGGDFQVVNVGLLMDDRVRSPRRKPVAGAPGCQSPCSESRPILGSGMIAMEGEDGMPNELVRATPSCQDIAERGEAIYGEKYRAELEKSSNGKFIAINVANADATIADTGEDAIRLALEKDPSGFFHLMRVGHKAAFEGGWYMSSAR